MKVDERDLKRWRKAAKANDITLSAFVRKAVEHAIEMGLDFSPKPTFPASLSKVPHPPRPKILEIPVEVDPAMPPDRAVVIIPEKDGPLKKITVPSRKELKKTGLCLHRVPVGSFCKRCVDGE